MTAASAKYAYIETARGLACVLLVAYHLVGDTPLNGLQLPNDHMLALLNRMFEFVRMPLFSFISGLVFSSAAANGSVWRSKLTGKARRLLLPMAAVSSLHFAFQAAFAHGSSGPFWQIFFVPYEHFWYLQAAFLLMLTTLSISVFTPQGDVGRNAWIALIVAALVFVSVNPWQPDIFSSYKALYLAPFFFLGLTLKSRSVVRADGPLGKPITKLLRVVMAVSMFVTTCLIVLDVVEPILPRRIFGVAAGLSMCLLVASLQWSARPLTWLGGYSYAIYLFHVFFTAGSRVAIGRVWDASNPLLLFAVGIVAGLAGPIVLGELFVRNRVTALLFLGIDTRKATALQTDPSSADGPDTLP